MTSIEKSNGPTAVARPLRILVPLIKDEIEAGDKAGIEHYRRAGEMLIESKAQLEHGEWMGWLKRNFELSRKTALRYMNLVRAESKRDRAVPFENLQSAVRPKEVRWPTWTKPVKEVVSRVNVEALAKERQNREKEDRLIRQLGIQLIDIGYKVLAAKLHPDKPGGSAEAMARLNKVRSLLKEAI